MCVEGGEKDLLEHVEAVHGEASVIGGLDAPADLHVLRETTSPVQCLDRLAGDVCTLVP